jgi:peptide/nickel transport system permease protein
MNSSSLGNYLVRRVLQVPIVLLAIIITNFVLIHLAPGDPAAVMTGEFGFTGGKPTDYLEQVRDKWGLTKPLWEQLLIYVGNVLHGDLGYSFAFNKPVAQLIIERIPATLLLVLTSEVLAIVLGTVLGTLAARTYPSRLDQVLSTVAIGFHSVPVFWTGLMLVLALSVRVRLFPTSGMLSSATSTTDPLTLQLPDIMRHMFLPTLALVLYLTPIFLRVTRASVLEVMKEDFMATARAKGLSENAAFFGHALRNALLPTVTLAGVLVGSALSGAVLTETVFAWPGIGRLLYEAIGLRDYPLIMGMLVMSSFGVVVASLVTDILYRRFDPRVTYT